MSDLRARARPASTPAPAPAPPAPPIIPTNPRLSKKSPKTTKTSTPLVTPTATFAFLLLARLLSARYATIPDCDEVFNFWEPAHYLSHSHGLQTWEYSPLYAIRSWAYVLLHSALSRPVSFLPGLSKIHEFYALRAVFAVACAYSETRLYRAVARNVDRRVGALYLVFAAGSAGMFHAAVAFLPSTFAMYTGMLAAAAFLEGGLVEGIVWTAVGGFLGWPFCLVMCVPWLLGALVVGAVDGSVLAVVVRCIKGGLWSAGLLAIIVAIDSAFYRKLEIVPLNIVLYNVFSDASRGPNIYGTEPWHFYILNLTLNHNILLPLSLAALPTLALSALLKAPTTRREITMTLPYYLWLAIFTLQPHKEERFMFLAYPMLLVNAAIALNHALHIVVKVLPSRTVTRLLATAAVILTTLLSLSRTLAVTTSYSAPLSIYAHLSPDATGNLCLGAEWYRFPSHYFVPSRVRAKWIPAGFHGLLPGEFPEEGGAWKVPLGMNDMNIEDEGKYVKREECDYVVGLEQERLQEVGWVLKARERFLEKDATGFLGRVFWAPAWLVGERRVWSWYELWARV